MTFDPEWNQPDDDYRDEDDGPQLGRNRREGPAVDLTNLSVRVVLTALLVGLAVLFFFLLVRPRGAVQPEPTATVLAAQGGTVVLPTFTPGATATPPATATSEAATLNETPTESAASAPPSELAIGTMAEVANTDNLGVRLRSGPGLNFATVLILAEGTRVKVVDGPREADSFTWWQVETVDGATTGWAAGDFLKPAAP
ncbi:MAG: SH3 domain-containing protein [Ardenticatenaceae bacterium]|nr:SH3 domain-containing protein [Ardenticatenaceae bacterium]HBY92975.1 hypothetical protein [Chloroflexota bacterium]